MATVLTIQDRTEEVSGIMEISGDKRADVLLALLKERYEASHKMRDRSYNFSVWIMGLGMALVWLILSRPDICSNQRITLSALVVAMGLLSFRFLRNIDRGFEGNRAIMIRIERTIGCYEKSLYCDEESLYPKRYQELGKTATSHFLSLYILLVTLGLGIIALLWI